MSEQIDVVFPDLMGLTHGKTVPDHRLEYPTHYAITCMVQGIDLGFLEIPKYSTGAGFPDMEARVELDTVRPWRDGRKLAMGSLFFSNGEPLPLDSRRQLRMLCDEFEALGYTPLAGFEMEFFLLSTRTPLTRLPVPDHRVYGIGAGADPTGTIEEIVRFAEYAQLQVEGMNSEFTPSQAEVSLHYQEALEAADCAVLFREMSRIVARSRDIDVTYMARPFGDTVGNGLHANISLATKDGENAFDDPSDDVGISQVAKHFMAGLLEHHEALTAFAAPTVNSYKRLTPGMLSGYWANWGIDNRIATVRVPGQRGKATRLEHRMADGTASPHLLLSALLAAGLHGIQAQLPLPEPQVGDADAAPNTDRHTPHNLNKALDALEADEKLRSYLEPDLVEVFVALKRREYARWMEAVTDWEQNEYSRVY